MWALVAKKVGKNIYLAPSFVSKVRPSHKVKGYTKQKKWSDAEKKVPFLNFLERATLEFQNVG